METATWKINTKLRNDHSKHHLQLQKLEALHQNKKENSKNNKITTIRFHVAQNHNQIKLLFLSIAIHNFKLATIDSNTQLAAQH